MPIPPCPELARELHRYKRLQKFFHSLDDSQRIWIIEDIQSAKREETRQRRAARAAEWLMEVMEAERDLPPAFKIAFSRSPKARRAWESRDLLYRRATLLQIFSRPGPVSRAKAVPALIAELELSVERELERP
jgi:Bacteriocin-protection, YdeI or OmpD-Associated